MLIVETIAKIRRAYFHHKKPIKTICRELNVSRRAVRKVGMRTSYDELMATGIKRQHEPPRIVGDLLKAEIAEKQARSIIRRDAC